jgi:thiol:disulfide interchange protein
MSESTVPPATLRPRQRTPWGGVVFIAALVVVYLVVTRPTPPPEGWGSDYAAALEEAADSGRKVLCAFYLDGCPPCKVMDRTVLTTAEVKAALHGFVPVRVNLSREPELATRFGAIAAPTYIVVGADGAMLAGHVGPATVEEFVAFLKRAARASGEADPPSDP